MSGIKQITFIIVVHTLLWGAAANGMIQAEGGASNPNKQLVDRFLSGQFSDTVSLGENSGIIDQTVGLGVRAADGIGYIAGILFSPLKIFTATQIPLTIAVMFQAIFTFWEGAIILSFIRGYQI